MGQVGHHCPFMFVRGLIDTQKQRDQQQPQHLLTSGESQMEAGAATRAMDETHRTYGELRCRQALRRMLAPSPAYGRWQHT